MPHYPGAVALTRHMLWNREKDAMPAVVLLGPVGSGKSHALGLVDRDLGQGVVHARFDFSDRAEDSVSVTTVLTRLVYSLSARWPRRPKPRFTHFAVALLAMGLPLQQQDRDADRGEMRRALKQLSSARGNRMVDSIVEQASEAVVDMGMLPAEYARMLKVLLPHVMELVRTRLARTIRSLGSFPGAEKWHDPLDALLDLNYLARGARRNISATTDWLVDAFLVDVAQNHRRMSAVERSSPCDCVNPDRRRHVHNWVLLLDNVHHPAGERFLEVLVRRRAQRAARVPAVDPLLVIGTSNRWNPAWEPAWRPTWQFTGPGREVARGRDARDDRWTGVNSPYYPVLLDPLPRSEIGKLLDGSASGPSVDFVQRATGGLPVAVLNLRDWLARAEVRLGDRDRLDASGQPDAPWLTWLGALCLTSRLDGVELENIVTAAPFATAPWLIPLPTRVQPNPRLVGPILTELRSSLWVLATAGEEKPDHVVLHPWIAGNLAAALRDRPQGSGPSWEDQFGALRQTAGEDGTRLAYCALALGNFVQVVDMLAGEFWRIEPRDWLDKLIVAVQAPDTLPRSDSHHQLATSLVACDYEHVPAPGRDAVRSNVARLLAYAWLITDPFVVREPEHDTAMSTALKALAHDSRHTDVTAYTRAADLALIGRWP